MRMQPILSLSNMPFCIGACDRPSNPAPLPDRYPIELCLNVELARLELAGSPPFEELLKSAYQLGIEMGTPSDETELGNPYVMDFMAVIEEFTGRTGKGRALEIGAGVGYLSSLLLAKGWLVDSIEPGKRYARHWEKHGLRVINEFFPTLSARGPYELIVFYTVLEHIKDTKNFLMTVANHLSPSGKIILAVPDCSWEIKAGDPSMLLHEHFQYFTLDSLERTLADGGFHSVIRPSKFGRSIYACGVLGNARAKREITEKDLSPLRSYARKVRRLRSFFRELVADLVMRDSVGIYCPGRALAVLSNTAGIRFFDDAAALQGKYYPPFTARIESRSELVDDPPRTLIIMSRTFGAKLLGELKPLLPHTRILLGDELLYAGR